MNTELICAWLGLAPDVWPPDHYRLLGLNPGEEDVSLIEQRVHQRLDSVRPYQMLHPEPATEAMNRLAQAFICLTEPAAKMAYDQSLLGPRVRPVPPPLPSIPPSPVAPPAAPRPAVAVAVPRDPLVWMYTPSATGPTSELPAAPVHATAPTATVVPPPLPVERVAPPPPVKPPEPAEPPPEPVDSVVEAAQASPQAQRGLATKRALYHRVARTRKLLELWHRAGKSLADAETRLSKQEAAELRKVVNLIEEALENFPLLGEAGQPGYLIVNLTQLDKARDLQGLTVRERESLHRDWKAGLKFLEAHRDYLRGELRAQKQRGWGARMVRLIRAFLNEPVVVLLLVLLAVAAVGFGWWRSR